MNSSYFTNKWLIHLRDEDPLSYLPYVSNNVHEETISLTPDSYGLFTLHRRGTETGTGNDTGGNESQYIAQKCSHYSETQKGTKTHCLL